MLFKSLEIHKIVEMGITISVTNRIIVSSVSPDPGQTHPVMEETARSDGAETRVGLHEIHATAPKHATQP